VPIRSARRSEIDGPAELHARRDVAELASMEDRMLRDMGISRNGFGARPWFAAINPKTLAGGGTDCSSSARPGDDHGRSELQLR